MGQKSNHRPDSYTGQNSANDVPNMDENGGEEGKGRDIKGGNGQGEKKMSKKKRRKSQGRREERGPDTRNSLCVEELIS